MNRAPGIPPSSLRIPARACWLGILPVLLAAALGRAEPSAPTCALLEKAVAEAHKSSPTVADTVFTPLAPPSLPSTAVTLRYGGIEFRLPDRRYRCVRSSNGRTGQVELNLVVEGTRDIISIGPMIGGDPMPDTFAFAGQPADDGHSPARIRYTADLFGKAPTLLDLLEAAYRVRATGFTCQPHDLLAATRDAYVLIIKTTGQDRVRSRRAHRDAGLPGSVLLVQVTDDERRGVDYFARQEGGAIAVQALAADPRLADELVALLSTLGGRTPPGLALRPLDSPCEAAPLPGP